MMYSLSEHFDMLYAQNGATDAELRHDEHGHVDLGISGT